MKHTVWPDFLLPHARYQNLETDKKSEKMNIKIEKNLTSKLCKAFVAEDVTSVWPNNFTPV